MALTDITIRNAKPKEKPYKLGDSGGLFLLVQPTGGNLCAPENCQYFRPEASVLCSGPTPATPVSAANPIMSGHAVTRLSPPKVADWLFG